MSLPILLTTLNAKYHHTAFGLRYLYANLGELKEQAKIVEFTINQNPRDIAETILKNNPRILGIGVYIWNAKVTLELVSILKRVAPDLIIVLGGPEVSYETESQPICQLANFVIRGEAEFLFYEFCKNFLESGRLPSQRWISGELPELKKLELPYQYYSKEDVAHRVIYVEASRGCPYKCEYCLSSLDKSVRSFDLEVFLGEMETLIERGVRQFKFVDRTFNLSITTSSKILGFFLDRISKGLFLHFEMVPDRLPVELRQMIQKFPAGSLQFEVGIQTWNPGVAHRVSRRQDYEKIVENLKFLNEQTQVHAHVDLIAGLPGETMESFASGFDAISSIGPQEIQVGILKRLKGTPIIRHDQEWQMIYQEHPPFQVLSTKTMNFNELQEIGRLATFWDHYSNSGNFVRTMALFKSTILANEESYFYKFLDFTRFLTLRHPQGNGVSLLNLVESIWLYLTEQLHFDPAIVKSCLIDDYSGQIKRDVPVFLRSESTNFQRRERRECLNIPATPNVGLCEELPISRAPKRQTRHQLRS